MTGSGNLDPTRPFADTPKILRSRRRTQKRNLQRQAEHRTATISDQVEERFGPNPCQRLTFYNEETSETHKVACNTRRCPDCGPRKQGILKQQLRHLGQRIWAARHHNINDVNRALERAKKQHQRNADKDFTYTIVGDEQRGWIIISDTQLIPEQRLMKLDDWMDRILHAYRYSDGRMRRSRILGTMSLVAKRAVAKLGTSPWKAVFQRHQTQHDEMLDAIIAGRDEENPTLDWQVWDDGGVLKSSIRV